MAALLWIGGGWLRDGGCFAVEGEEGKRASLSSTSGLMDSNLKPTSILEIYFWPVG